MTQEELTRYRKFERRTIDRYSDEARKRRRDAGCNDTGERKVTRGDYFFGITESEPKHPPYF